MHTSTGFILAIKMVNLSKEAGEKEKESIRKESEILRKLNDDNIVKYYGSSFPEQQLWVRVEKQTVDHFTRMLLIRLRRFSWSSAREGRSVTSSRSVPVRH